tara:strand:+ start:3225 stop:4010 length:786 start_codon:yes stop_codon:yes gene_type:complete
MLKTRIFTAAISLIILLTAIFIVPAPVTKNLFSLVILIGAWEWSGFLNYNSKGIRYSFVTLILLLILFVDYFLLDYSNHIFQIACIWWFIAFIWLFLFPTSISKAFRIICGVLVLLPLHLALIELYNLSAQILLLALAIIWAADMGAYFVGKQFGRVKLAPKISPKKTWEGVFGGLTMVTLIALTWTYLAELNILVSLPFCLAIGVLSVVGDLTVSMFKRDSGMKDSGKLFPGHGGILDRIDSIAAAAPCFSLGITQLGLL